LIFGFLIDSIINYFKLIQLSIILNWFKSTLDIESDLILKVIC